MDIGDTKVIRALPDLKPGQSNDGFEEVQKYLRRYGYLDRSKSVANELCPLTHRSVMFPSVSAGRVKRELTDDDLQAVRFLYSTD